MVILKAVLKAVLWILLLNVFWFFVHIFFLSIKVGPFYPDEYGWAGMMLFLLFTPFAWIILPLTYVLCKAVFGSRTPLYGHLAIAVVYFSSWLGLQYLMDLRLQTIERLQTGFLATMIGIVSWLIFSAAMKFRFTE